MQKGNTDRSFFDKDQRSSWEYALSKTQAMAHQRDSAWQQQPLLMREPPSHIDGQDMIPYGHGWGPRASWTAGTAALPGASADGSADWQQSGNPGTTGARSKWQPMHRSSTAVPSNSNQAGQQPVRDIPPAPARSHLARSLSLVSLRGTSGGQGATPAVALGPSLPSSATRARSASLGRKGKKGPEKMPWETLQILLQRVPRFGFGIAVAGGRDAPHFASGDPSIVVSDVIKGGPAEGKLFINDRVLSVNGVSLENVDHSRAIALLKEGGSAVNLTVKRKSVDRSHADLGQPSQAPVQTTAIAAPANGAAFGKVTLVKKSRRDEFGIIFGFKLYVKELPAGSLAARSGLIHEGDVVLKINNVSTDTLSLVDAAKLVERASSRGVGEKLSLHIKRPPDAAESDAPASTVRRSMSLSSLHKPRGDDANSAVRQPYHPPLDLNSSQAYSSNDYNAAYQKPESEKAGMQGYGLPASSRVFGQNLESTGPQQSHGQGHEVYGAHCDPSGPSWNTSSYSSKPEQQFQAPSSVGPAAQEVQQLYKANVAPRISGAYHSSVPENRVDGRRVSYCKEGNSPGIGLAGGNATGTFVSVVLDGSPADAKGVLEGDQILEVNDCSIHGMSREEVFTMLVSCKDRVRLTLKHPSSTSEYSRVVASGGAGDLFYVRAHFKYSGGSKHMGFQPGDLLRITDTLVGGDSGEWMAEKLEQRSDKSGHVKSVASGLVPSAKRAAELVTAHDYPQDDEEDDMVTNAKPSPQADHSPNKSSISGLFKRRGGHAKEKHSSKSHFEDVILGAAPEKFQAYEHVALRKPGFARPLVIYGCLADIARDLLCRHHPEHYEHPQSTASGAIHLSAIHDAMSRGKHCVLVAGPGSLRRLVRAHYAPIAILLRADGKASAKELRERFSGRMPPRRASASEPYDRGVEVESMCAHLLSATVPVSTNDSEHDWTERLHATAMMLQHEEPIWMATGRPVPGSSADDRPGVAAAAAAVTTLAPASATVLPASDQARVDGTRDDQAQLSGAQSRPAVSSAPTAAAATMGTAQRGGMDLYEQASSRLASSAWCSVTKPTEGLYERCSGSGGAAGARIEQSGRGDIPATVAGVTGRQSGQDPQPQPAPGWNGAPYRSEEAGAATYNTRETQAVHHGPRDSELVNSAEVGRQLYDAGIMRVPTGSLAFRKNSDYATINKLRASSSSYPQPDGQRPDMDRSGERTGLLTRENAELDFVLSAERYRNQVTAAPGISVHDRVGSHSRNWEAERRAWPETGKAEPQAASPWSVGGGPHHRHNEVYESSGSFRKSPDNDSGRKYVTHDLQQQSLHSRLPAASRPLTSSGQSQVNPDNFWLNHNSFDAGPDAVLYHAVPLIVSDIRDDSSLGEATRPKQQNSELYPQSSDATEDGYGRRQLQPFNGESTVKSSL